MENISLIQQIAAMKQSFLDEEILDEVFSQLESLSSDDNANFVEDTLHEYFQETNEYQAAIEKELEKNPIDFSAVERALNILKRSSASVGAIKVKNEVTAATACCDNGDVEGAKAGFEKVKMEVDSLKAKLNSYFELVKQAKNPK